MSESVANTACKIQSSWRVSELKRWCHDTGHVTKPLKKPSTSTLPAGPLPEEGARTQKLIECMSAVLRTKRKRKRNAFCPALAHTVFVHTTLHIELAPSRCEAVSVSGGRHDPIGAGDVEPSHGFRIIHMEIILVDCRQGD